MIEKNTLASRPSSGSFTSNGIRCRVASDGGIEISRDDLMELLCNEADKLPKQSKPTVKEAQDAREIVNTLLSGMGGDIEDFKKTSNQYITDIRAVRMAVATEVSQIIQPLSDIRKFFLAHDHKDEVARLKEFVDLCERLQALKSTGFLDTVADTILKLTEVKS
jgi:hypothetical protein